jgi:ribosome-binding protein aMBF1 (putative translation factor)
VVVELDVERGRRARRGRLLDRVRAQAPKIDPALAAAVRRMREERGLSREALAFRCGISPASLEGIEGAQLEPNWSTVRGLVRGMDAALVELVAAVEGRGSGPRRGERRLTELLAELTAVRQLARELRAAEGGAQDSAIPSPTQP